MTVSDIPDRHANINPASRNKFSASPASQVNSQIPDPVNKLIVFPIPASYFGQIPNPENTLPDPVSRLRNRIEINAVCKYLHGTVYCLGHGEVI